MLGFLTGMRSSYASSTTCPLMRYDLPRKSAIVSPRWFADLDVVHAGAAAHAALARAAVSTSPSRAGAMKSIAQPEATVVRL